MLLSPHLTSSGLPGLHTAVLLLPPPGASAFAWLPFRILELTEQIPSEDGDLSEAVELWDCSGDQKYEGCWPAICDKLDGAVVSFDPTNKSQANDVRIWCEWSEGRRTVSCCLSSTRVDGGR